MIRSMTGYGSSIRETEFGRLSMEIRSVNNRFLELNLRLGSTFIHLDQKVRSVVRASAKRGKLDIILRFDPSDDMIPPVRINEALYQKLRKQLERIHSGQHITAGDILSLPGVVVTESSDSGNDELDAIIFELLKESLEKLGESRDAEGEKMLADFRKHHEIMSEHLTGVVGGQSEVTAKYRERLFTRIEELMQQQGATIDEGRLEMEVAVFADKADITEEINRLGGHLDALGQKLTSKKLEGGKGLEFLGQEMLREVNTIGSKCRDLDLARHVIDMKQELESLRENLANVE